MVHTPESGKVSGESSQSLPNYPWTREGFKLPESKKELFKLSQEIQKLTPPLTNLMLSDSRIGKFFGRAVLSRGMDTDTYAHARSHSIEVEDTISQIGVHLSQVNKLLYKDLKIVL